MDYQVLSIKINSLSEKEKVQLMEVEPSYFRFIKNPSDEVIWKAVEKQPSNLSNIDNQSYELCIMAIKIDPLVIRYCNIQTEYMKECAIEQNWLSIAFIENPSMDNIKRAIELSDGQAKEIIPTYILDEMIIEE